MQTPLTTRRKLALPALLLTVLMLASAGYAGRGGWRLAERVVDLYLYLDEREPTNNLVYSTTDASKLSYWFNEASKKMWNATEGHLRIGTIYVYNKTKNGKDSADIHFLNGAESASANVDGLGGVGTHLYFRMPFANGFQVPARFIQNSFVHEFGHYGFGLYDEYLGFIRARRPTVTGGVIEQNYIQNAHPGGGGADYWGWNGGGDKGQTAGRIFYSTKSRNTTALNDASWTACLMNLDYANNVTEFAWDGDYPYNTLTTDTNSGLVLPGHLMALPRIVSSRDGTTVLLAAGNYWVSTAQEEKHRKSPWAVVASKLGLANLTAAPGTAMPAGFVDIRWVVLEPRLCVELCIDRSGSMGYGSQMEQAKEGAKLFAYLAKLADTNGPGDFLGVVDFDDRVTVTAPIRELQTEADRNAILAAIDTLFDRGMTSIGGGLDRSRQQIVSVGQTNAGEMIVLLSDGQENTSPYVSSVLPAVVARGIKVYTISLGDYADLPLMQNIASQTGGRHFYCKTSAQLQDAYTQISQLVQASEVASAAQGTLAPGAEISHQVSINQGASEATFILNGSSPDLEFSVRPPTGPVITRLALPANARFVASGSSKIFTIFNPQAGLWTPIISAPESTNGITYARVLRPPAPIPDGGILVRTINVTENAIISSIFPSIGITHSYVGDLKVTLRSPRGTAVVLHNRSGGGNQNLQGTYGVNLYSSGSLSAFRGQSTRGLWQLTVQDASLNDTGVLESWGLAFNTTAPEELSRYELLTGLQDTRISVTVGASNSIVHYPTSAVLYASVNAGGPVAGAKVTALVVHPDGEFQTLVELADDGRASYSGDTQQGDGIYTGRFGDYTQDGVYLARVMVTCTNGYVSLTGNGDSTNELRNMPAPKFTRQESFTFNVEDVPNPMGNAIRVATLAVVKKTNNYGFISLVGTFDAEPWQYDPKQSAVDVRLDSYSLYASSYYFKQIGRRFEYRWTNTTTREIGRLIVRPFRGGTSRCQYEFVVTNENVSSISFPSTNPTIDVDLDFGPNISDRATLYMSTSVAPNGTALANYRTMFNGEVQPALYIQSALVQFVGAGRTPQDYLRLVATVPGWALGTNLTITPVEVEFGSLRYTFPAGSLVRQANGTYKATLLRGNLTLLINPDQRLLQLSARYQNLRAFQNPAGVRLTMGSQAQLARIQMFYTRATKTYTY